MERKRYPGCLRFILPKLALFIFFTVVPTFSLGIYLKLAHGIDWALWVFGISSVLVFGLISQLLIKKLFRSLPCPNCGCKNLLYSKDADRWHVLTCQNCSIVWETGLGDGDNT